MCTSWDVHKTIQHVEGFNGRELWLTSLKQLSEVERKNMTISKVEIDRLSVTSSKSFEAVLARSKRPSVVRIWSSLPAQSKTRRPLLNWKEQSIKALGILG
jgi:hypothetical protein